MKVYKFVKYEKVYPVLYANEKKRINKSLSNKSLIEHIGSTAVCELSGKGIIDIMIACPKNEMRKIKNKLVKKSYEERRSSDKGRIFMRRETKIKGKQRRFHLHITSLNHNLWKEAVGFKNYLVKYPKIAKEYALLKKKAVIECENNGEVYRKLKNKFITKHTKKAMRSKN